VWLNRNILMGLQWDYRNLELFRAAAGDKYRLHLLAMRAVPGRQLPAMESPDA
jgi:hypothetical protein